MNARRLWISVIVVGIGSIATCAAADVDLVWSPNTQAVLVGTVLEIDLFAIPDPGQQQTISAIDVVLTWDPQRLLLLGVVDNGPYEWLESGFKPFGQVDFDGLSESLVDGDAKYTALSAAPGEPAVATSNGLLVTTFQFYALSEVDSTEVVIEDRLSATAITRVFGGDAPNQVVTGELNNTSATIIRRHKTLRPRPPLPSTERNVSPIPDITDRSRRARSYTETSDP